MNESTVNMVRVNITLSILASNILFLYSFINNNNCKSVNGNAKVGYLHSKTHHYCYLNTSMVASLINTEKRFRYSDANNEGVLYKTIKHIKIFFY